VTAGLLGTTAERSAARRVRYEKCALSLSPRRDESCTMTTMSNGLVDQADTLRNETVNKNLFLEVEEIELDVISANCLRNANIRYIGELVQSTEHDTLQLKNFGRKHLEEIKQVWNLWAFRSE
jgi:DNA-directed RNA polymerase alpha subunit